VANGGGGVSILIGQGDGTFTGPTNVPTAGGSTSIAIGDFDGDDKPDLAATGFFTANVSILRGAGDGTFAAAGTVPVGPGPYGIAADDLNGDDDPDLVTSNQDDGTVTAVLGGPGTTFGTARSFPAGGGPWTVQTSDFNEDGRRDLAVALEGDQAVGILLGRAEPTLSTTATASIPHGGTISDSATIAGGDDPSGELTFKAYGPNDADCSGEPAFSDTVTVDGNGTYDSAEFKPTQSGTYRWIASYAGDRLNAAVAGACNDPGETSIVEPDTTPPVISLVTPANGARYDTVSSLLNPVRVSYSCSDSGSGIASCTGTQPNGATLNTGLGALGSHTFTVTAVDKAGNTATVTHRYTVALLPILI